jgi:hypothetical protein
MQRSSLMLDEMDEVDVVYAIKSDEDDLTKDWLLA